MTLSHDTPRRRATASRKASRVNGEGSFSAVEISPSGTSRKQTSMSSTLLTTAPQVPSSSRSTSSASKPR